jgi:hypothetical protein
MLLGIIKEALAALTAYLQLKNKSMYYNVTRLSRAKQKEVINEIEKLRTAGTNASNDRADLLRNELLDERRFLDDISAYYNKVEERIANQHK